MISKSGYNTASSISVWGESQQREMVDVHQYWTGIQALQPDIFVSLCDSDIPENSTSKRAQKASKFTQKSIEVLVERNQDMNLLHIGPIEGGYLENLRMHNTQWVAKQPLDGYFLDGFHNNGPTSLDIALNKVVDVLQSSVLPYLPKDKPRFYFGMIGPHEVLDLVRNGVDFFETSFVYNKSDLGHALTFRNTAGMAGITNNQSENLPSNCQNDETEIENKETLRAHIDLNLAMYKNDFGPILKNCSCYACRKYTRGYINHLLATKELLAGVLLTIHNLHHYAIFFQSIREAIANDTFETFAKQFDNIEK